MWADGRRAKFWGVNISNRSVFVERETIDRVVETLARAGTNMVRFEALDSYGGLLDVAGSDSSRSLDPGKLATLDYWIARLRERGIYYYLDLLDFRQFKPADGVPAYDALGRAARPYAFFDPRLVDLQKEFAYQLLTHLNPHTGRRYVDDPALALVEICNEHGLFMKADSLDALAEPYGTALRQAWNRWLVQRYGSRDAIRRAWGRLVDVDVLGPEEDPGVYSINLPLFSASPGANTPDVVDVRRAPGRLRDGVRFLYETQRAYFRDMKAYLREIGLKVPVTGVVSNDIAPDLASVAAELDFTSENYYFDHPAFAERDWEGSFFYNDRNPLRAASTYHVAPWLAALRWENKPVVVREWATVWPNRFRAVAVPEMAAYASLQDFDAVLLFGYQVHPTPNKLSDFDHQGDPTVWGMYALGALAFLRGDIAPAARTVTLAYTPDTLFQWPSRLGSDHLNAWRVRLNSRFVPRVENRKAPTETPLRPSPIRLVSSTGQIVRDTQRGLLSVVTPRLVAVCGELPVGRPIRVGDWAFSTRTPIGALMAVSLDGRPLSSSRRYIVKMVSRAENTGQELEPAAQGAPARFRLKATGNPPVLSLGRPSRYATMLRRNDKPILSLAMENGTWELMVDRTRATLVCDTPGIRARLFGRVVVTEAGRPITVNLPATAKTFVGYTPGSTKAR